MQLWICEYRHVFTSKTRLTLFQCPTDFDPKFIAEPMIGNGEYIHNLEQASQALGYDVQYINIDYKKKRQRVPKYGYYRVNR